MTLKSRQEKLDEKVRLHGLWLEGAPEGKKAILDHEFLEDLILSGRNLAKASLVGANLNGAKLNSTDLTKADLTGACLNNSSMKKISLHKACLKDAHLRSARLSNGMLESANFDNADLSKSNLGHASLYKASLKKATLYKTNLSNALISYADLEEADLEDAILRRAVLVKSNLKNAKLNRANLNGAILTRANLEGASIKEADLALAELTWANLMEADLENSNTLGTNFSGAKNNFLDPIKFIDSNFEKVPEGIIAYKWFNLFYHFPEYWEIKPGSILEENVNHSNTLTCGCGVSVATLGYMNKTKPLHPEEDRRVWKCLIKWEWLPGVCVPMHSMGDMRAQKIMLLEEGTVEHFTKNNAVRRRYR